MGAKSKTWRNRIIGTGEEAPDQLVANPRNWRTHPGQQREALRGSLDTVGWVQQVMVNRTTGNIVDGHARVEEALTRGEPTVPVLYVDLTEEEEALVLATLDPIGAMAAADDERLRALLAEVGDHDAGLNALLATLAPPLPVEGLTDPDAVPEVADDGGVKRGDIYALGDHRLMCGDSTDGGDVALLMNGSLAAMVMADPPYNVNYTGGSTNDREREDSYADAWTQGEYGRWLCRVLECAAGASDDKAALHIWFGSQMMRPVLDAIDTGGWERRQQIIWNKTSPHYGALGAQYKLRYEPMWYCHKAGQSPRWYGPSNEPAVWDHDQPRVNDLHPTMKPIALYERSLSNHTAPRDGVLECFSGSGTTLIAAEKTGRRCYAMEIEPRYVAVSIRRWEEFTGRKAVKLA